MEVKNLITSSTTDQLAARLKSESAKFTSGLAEDGTYLTDVSFFMRKQSTGKTDAMSSFYCTNPPIPSTNALTR